MSIHSSVNFGSYALDDLQPEWMRSERYEYCEHAVAEAEHKSWFEKLIAFFM